MEDDVWILNTKYAYKTCKVILSVGLKLEGYMKCEYYLEGNIRMGLKVQVYMK